VAMPSGLERALARWLASGRQSIGQIIIAAQPGGGFVLCHRDDQARTDLVSYENVTAAEELARFDEIGNYRPLRTSPNLQCGWRLELRDVVELRQALDFFYPGRLAALFAFERNALTVTPFRETIGRQSGMYRVAAKISDAQADDLVGRFCGSQGGAPGCLRTILWKRDSAGAVSSSQLPETKFDPAHDQTGGDATVMPLLCQEACNLLIAAAREVVKGASQK
jgi:sirohydrochlorin cobaltochelatase